MSYIEYSDRQGRRRIEVTATSGGVDFAGGAKGGGGEQQTSGRAAALAAAEREKGLYVCVWSVGLLEQSGF